MNNVQELKEKGNQAFKQKDYNAAIKFFTEAIEIDSSDHVTFSNRSACYFNLGNFDMAHNDAEVCIVLKSDWWKGYYRKGLAELKLGKLEEAKKTINEGIKYEDNLTLRGVLTEITESKLNNMNPFGNLDKLYQHPKTKEYMKDPLFVMNVMAAMNNPEKLSELFLKDPRYGEALGVLTGVDFSSIDKNGFVDNFMNQFSGKGGSGMKMDPLSMLKNLKFDDLIPNKGKESCDDPGCKDDHSSPKEEEAKAETLKNKGNDCFRENKLEEALKYYNEAIQLNPNSATLYSNRSACFNKLNRLEDAMEDCDQAIKLDKKFIKAYIRKCNILMTNQQYKEAKEVYQEGLKVMPNEVDLINGLAKCEESLKRSKSGIYT